MSARERLAWYGKSIRRPEFYALLVPLSLILLSPFLGDVFHANTIEGWSFVVCIFWGPLMVWSAWGAGKAWDDFKRPRYPKGLALLALGLNLLAPFVVIYFVLYA